MASPTPHITCQPSTASKAVFTFTPLPLPTKSLCFPTSTSGRSYGPSSRKRGRALTDIDEENSCPWKKKRRLRLFLITSRLSSPYSAPATNIVDRGSSKIAVWARQKSLGRHLLRKAAVLNRIRRRALNAREDEGIHRIWDSEKERKQFEMAKLTFLYGSHDTHTRPVLQRPSGCPPMAAVRIGNHFALTGSPNAGRVATSSASSSNRGPEVEEVPACYSPNAAYSYPSPRAQLPRRDYIPPPPSPLGLSNYDALDLEDEILDPYADLDEENDDEMDDANHCGSPSAATSASFATTFSTAVTSSTADEAIMTPPQMIYSDFNFLEPGEAVVGDYEGIDGVDGVDAVWPSITVPVIGEGRKSSSTRPSSSEEERLMSVQRDWGPNVPYPQM